MAIQITTPIARSSWSHIIIEEYRTVTEQGIFQIHWRFAIKSGDTVTEKDSVQMTILKDADYQSIATAATQDGEDFATAANRILMGALISELADQGKIDGGTIEA